MFHYTKLLFELTYSRHVATGHLINKHRGGGAKDALENIQ